MNKKERKIQAALGTTPYLVDITRDKTKLKELVEIMTKNSPAPHALDSPTFDFIAGVILGGVITAVTLTDIEHLICLLSNSQLRGNSKIDWDNLEKDLKVFLKGFKKI